MLVKYDNLTRANEHNLKMATSVPIAVRGSTGVSIATGPPTYNALEKFKPVETKSCRAFQFSPDGQYFAYVYGSILKIVRTDTWNDVATIEGTKAYFLQFSPMGTYLVSWGPYEVTKANPQGSSNMNMYRCETGELVKGFVHKTQVNWEPKWSDDEKIFSKIVNTDVVFYEDSNFEKIVNRIDSCKVAYFTISPIVGTYYIVTHTLGKSGQPSFARLFKYPTFDLQQAIANKSFFQADKVDFLWNSKGTHAILLTSTEQDKTGQSYYGKQGLHFLGVNGQTNMISTGKEGPVHHVAWSPKGQEFCVVFGYMPSKATLYNLKCEVLYELGTGPRNAIYYNPQGNILLLGGFGNLRGNVELWDIVNRKLIGKCDASDTTLLEWSPDGSYFMTATTAPRLRIGNGYKIWHHTGALVFEKAWNGNEELHEVIWKKYSKNTFKDPTISSEKIEGIVSKDAKASSQPYRPPSARNRPGITFKLHDDDEPAHKPGGDPVPSKTAAKQKKKREARKARKAEEGEDNPEPEIKSNVQINLTGDPEKDKKLKNLKKKLDSIEKLKAEQAQGKPLQINQLAKIKGEADLLKELDQLQL